MVKTMTNSSVSPQAELDAVIQNYNPFNIVAIDKGQSIWGKGFPDVPEINADASQKVIDLIKQVQNEPDPKGKIQTLTVTGEVGAGKTQIIGRLRRKVVGEGLGLLSYNNAGKYGDLDLLRHQFLRTLIEQLARPGHQQEVSQLQEIATHLVNQVIPQYQRAISLKNNFDKNYRQYHQKQQNLINILGGRITKLKPKLASNSYILRAILWTLSEEYGSFAVEWLAGKELDQETATIMGLTTNTNKNHQQQEAEALDTLLQIIRISTEYKPLLICFDELETQGKMSSDGYTKAQVLTRFIKDLYDNLEQFESSKGVVILTAMLATTWGTEINSSFFTTSQRNNAIIDRISTATQGKPVSLQPIDDKLMVQLVSTWLQEELYKPRNLTPPYPTYPFAEEELREIGRKNKPSVREALDWCAKNYIKTPPPHPEESFQEALKMAKQEDFGEFMNNEQLIADAISWSFQGLIGKKLEGETKTGQFLKQVILSQVENLADKVQFKVFGTDNGQPLTLGVAVNQQTKATSVKPALNSLTNYKKYGLTRGCFVRSYDKKINKNTQTYELVKVLEENLGGEWVDLIAEELRPLLEIKWIADNCEKYNLTQAKVLELSQDRLAGNHLLLEILSDPKGVVDENAIMDGASEVVMGAFDDSSTTDYISDEELTALFEDS